MNHPAAVFGTVTAPSGEVWTTPGPPPWSGMSNWRHRAAKAVDEILVVSCGRGQQLGCETVLEQCLVDVCLSVTSFRGRRGLGRQGVQRRLRLAEFLVCLL
jgi:hypothetical protein